MKPYVSLHMGGETGLFGFGWKTMQERDNFEFKAVFECIAILPPEIYLLLKTEV